MFCPFEFVAWGVGTIFVLNSIKKLIVLNELLSSTTISSDVGDIVIGQDVPLPDEIKAWLESKGIKYTEY